MAEALAMREAVLEAKRTPLLKVWLRTDSQEFARAINSKKYLHNVIADSLAKSALHNLPSILVENPSLSWVTSCSDALENLISTSSDSII
ncbi:hypothetical protein F2Q70_00012756 [Brassica cretica]|nr:hypothetical protein F2Q70_00012756 [Brassica cretica]